MPDQWGRTACDTRCQRREERWLCSPPRIAAGMGRGSPGAELGVMLWYLGAQVLQLGHPGCGGSLQIVSGNSRVAIVTPDEVWKW